VGERSDPHGDEAFSASRRRRAGWRRDEACSSPMLGLPLMGTFQLRGEKTFHYRSFEYVIFSFPILSLLYPSLFSKLLLLLPLFI
jgi:hypothetical protein